MTEARETRPAGYSALIQRYGLEVLPNWHESSVAASGTHRMDATGDVVRETYLPSYWPGDSCGDHLEFALKYDGTNLALLASLFRAVDPRDIAAYVQSKPTGKYARRIWYLYEHLSGSRLPVEDIKRGNYYYSDISGTPWCRGNLSAQIRDLERVPPKRRILF